VEAGTRNAMTALEAVGVYVPSGRVPIEDLAEHFGLSTMQVQVFRRYPQLAQSSRELASL
jgi:3-oxoacyl-[acyl-carrier-protein] synthase-3